MTDNNEEFSARRMQARQASNTMQAEREAQGSPMAWFEDLYQAADGDIARVPWADGDPHPGLASWIAANPSLIKGRAIDVGSGLGENAVALQKAGFSVTGFDLSPTAVKWATKTNQGSGVSFHQANLFELPDEWLGAFDFVQETYTIQALKGDLRTGAVSQISKLVKPGGFILVICRSRADGQKTDGPPWPVSPSELSGFEQIGLKQATFEEFEIVKARTIPHFRVLYQRPL